MIQMMIAYVTNWIPVPMIHSMMRMGMEYVVMLICVKVLMIV